MTHKQKGLFIAGCAVVLILSNQFSLAPQIATGLGLAMTGVAALIWLIQGVRETR